MQKGPLRALRRLDGQRRQEVHQLLGGSGMHYARSHHSCARAVSGPDRRQPDHDTAIRKGVLGNGPSNHSGPSGSCSGPRGIRRSNIRHNLEGVQRVTIENMAPDMPPLETSPAGPDSRVNQTGNERSETGRVQVSQTNPLPGQNRLHQGRRQLDIPTRSSSSGLQQISGQGLGAAAAILPLPSRAHHPSPRGSRAQSRWRTVPPPPL
jgi:hypothetical protein